MKIQDLFKNYSKLEIDLLLMKILKKPKEFLYFNPNYELSASQLTNLNKLIKRRQAGEPIAYILGYKDFFGLRFKVNKNTLVPRPETEYLVEQMILDIQLLNSEKIKILDVGTGSGCIAISLAKQLQNKKNTYEVFASDISSPALLVAKNNAKLNRVKIKFYKSDLLKNIPKNLKLNIIVANLPYGWREWKNNTTTNTIGLKFEPEIALFTKERGLYEIRRLLEQINSRKNKPQFVFLEFDPRQKQDLNKLIKLKFPNSTINFYKDLADMWRFVQIKNI